MFAVVRSSTMFAVVNYLVLLRFMLVCQLSMLRRGALPGVQVSMAPIHRTPASAVACHADSQMYLWHAGA